VKISFNPRNATESEVESFLQDLAEKAKERDEPIRLRVQPQLYHPKGEKKGSGSYRSWRLLAWTLEMENIDELLAFRGALTHFIEFLERYGPVGTEQWFADTLKNMKEETDERSEPTA